MKSDKQFIEDIYKKYDEFQKEKEFVKTNEKIKSNNKKQIVYKIINLAAIFIIVFVIFVNTYMNDNTDKKEINILNNDAEVAKNDEISLPTVNNFENFYDLIKQSYKTEDVGEKSEINLEESTDSANLAGDKKTYSETNTQVENVDEADIVKTDGKYIYYISNKKVIIMNSDSTQRLELVSKIENEDDGFYPSELFINKNMLIVIGSKQEYSQGSVVYNTTDSIYKIGASREKTIVFVYDLTDIKNPEQIRTIEVEGNYLSSRMIENNIYFVTNKYLYAGNIARYDMKNLNEDDFKPIYRDTAVSDDDKYINFDKIYYFGNLENSNYLMISGFNIENKEEVDIKTFLGAGNNIYCSNENMYVAKTRNIYDISNYENLGANTKIIKFNLKNGKVNFKAETEVEGMINNQFSMDEFNGNFRIATTVGKTWNLDENTSNTLYVLDENLKEIGKLDGVAKGEKIYSVRYNGDKAYIVTFKEVDPLFVIDLSNPTNPEIIGELKIPGYSTYLHMYDDTHVIGFGYDTKANGEAITTNGLKMSMFDITDLSNPKEMFSTYIGDRYTYSELTYNHKALLFSKEKNLIAFPLNNYNKNYSKAQIYTIDLQNGFVLKGEVQENTNDYKYRIKRIIYINDIFYTFSESLVKAVDMQSIKEINRIEL